MARGLPRPETSNVSPATGKLQHIRPKNGIVIANVMLEICHNHCAKQPQMPQSIAASLGETDLLESQCEPIFIAKNVILSIIIFVLCLIEARYPDQISRPVARWVNSISGRNSIFDHVALYFALYNTFSGVILCAILLSISLVAKNEETKGRIFTGICMSFGAGVLSRFLQHHLVTHARPFYDAAVAFRTPLGVFIPPLNRWDSFPSDHACVFSGLTVVVLFVIKAEIRYYVAAWIFIVESSRIYIGAHLPCDLVGGAALASIIVWSFQLRIFVRVGEWICRWEYRAPLVFYALYFMLLYQVATVFLDIRNMTGGFKAFESLG